MKRQQNTPGAIVRIDLENGFYNYAQILGKGTAFFDIYTEQDRLEDLTVLLNTPVLFIVTTYPYCVATGRWLKMGKLPIRDDLKVLPMECVKDSSDHTFFELYNPNTGELTPATREQCEGLEAAAVWGANHVEDRLRDHYNGMPNVWVEQMRLKW